MNPVMFIIIGFAVLIGYVFYLRSKKPLTIEKRVKKIKDKRVLPSGMTLLVEDGASISPTEITAIEAGMQECFERAGQQGYSHQVQLSDYTVAIFADCEWHKGAWCYKIPTPDDYKGSVYDDNGVLWIAGQYLNSWTDQNVIILPDYDGNNLEVLSRVAGYEVEHVVLRYSDPVKYERTKVHTPEYPHPLF
jgi:hypothetical protein